MLRLVDVAEKSGVSVNTVSRVLNNRGYISDATREKVLKTIEELNYKPNQYARNLLKKKTDTIALLIQTIRHDFHASVISAVEYELRKRGYNFLLCNAEQKSVNERTLLNMLESYRVDGLIVLNYELRAEAYEKFPIPIVSIERYLREGVSYVTSDHAKGGEMAANALIKCGCKNVLQISGVYTNLKPWNVRHAVFSEVMEQNHVACTTVVIDEETITYDFQTRRRIVQDILNKHPDIDGFFATDLFAVAMQSEVKELGLAIPEDLKIIGYDGTIYSEIEDVSTVSQDSSALAKSAVKILFDLIDNDGAGCHIVQHNVELIERKSTKCR